MDRRTFIELSGRGTAGLLVGGSALSALFSSCSQINSGQFDEFINYDALGLALLIKKKEITPTELIHVVIRRIEALEGSINALTTRTFERALENAKHVSLDSTFAGVPILMKDMIDIAGIPRTDGSRLLQNNIGDKSVNYVKAIEKSGMIILGMTNVPEFTTTGITDNELFGPTHNPWNLAYSCNGSSGGAAAAVAAGYLPLVHGTDGGGSCRLPASACNLFGMKPSRYRMLSGELDGSHDMFKTNQAISRTVRDSAALFYETQDKSGKKMPALDLISGPSKRRLKIAHISIGLKEFPSEESNIYAGNEVAKLCASLGHHIEEIEHPVNGEEFFMHYNNAFLPKFGPLIDMVEQLSGKSAISSGLLTPFTISMAEFAKQISPEATKKGMEYLNNLDKLFNPIFDKYDIILSPTAPLETIKLGEISPQDQFIDRKAKLEKLLSLTAICNAVGNPAMSVPLSFSKDTGLPIGSMFQANIGNDKMLYELAYELEAAKPWKNDWAPNSINFK